MQGAPDQAAAARALVRLTGLLPGVEDVRLDEVADAVVGAIRTRDEVGAR